MKSLHCKKNSINCLQLMEFFFQCCLQDISWFLLFSSVLTIICCWVILPGPTHAVLNTTCIRKALNHLAAEELNGLGLNDKLQDWQNPNLVTIIYNLIHPCCISSHFSLLFFLSLSSSFNPNHKLNHFRPQVCSAAFSSLLDCSCTHSLVTVQKPSCLLVH